MSDQPAKRVLKTGGKPAKLVCFGQGGDSVEYGRGCHGSGYGRPENPHAADPTTCYIPDGCPVIDKRPAIATEAGYRWVFNGPMVNVDLADDECEPLAVESISPIFAQAVAENAYGGLLANHIATSRTKKRGSLDYVSTREYIDGWRAVGARIGHYQDGEIVWEE